MDQSFPHPVQGPDAAHSQMETRRLQDEIVDTFITYDDKVKFLQKILRGELSALEAYDKVLTRTDNHLVFSELSQIRSEHELSVNRLRQLIVNKGEPPEEGSGVWGQFVKTLIAGSAMISDEFIVKTLQEGEEHGLNEYRQFLEMNPTLTEEEAVRLHFIPAQERHILKLKDMSAHH